MTAPEMRVLVIDVGGTHVKILATGLRTPVGIRGLKRLGRKKWRRAVADVVERLQAALEPDYVVIGGGNAPLLKKLPERVRLGDNHNAFRGGFRLWEKPKEGRRPWTA